MNVPNVDFDKAKSIVLIIVILLILYFIWKIFLRDTSQEVTEASEKLSKMKGSDPYYYKKKQKITIVALGGKELASITKDIHDSMHFVGVGIKDQALMQAVMRIKSQRQLSQVNNYYQIKYKINLFNDLAKTLNDSVINKFASNDAYVKITKYLNSLPDAID